MEIKSYNTIGLVIPTPDYAKHPYYNRAEQTVKKVTSEKGYDLLLYTEDEVIAKTGEHGELGRDNFKCDGLVVFSPLKDREAYLAVIADWGLPCVLVRRRTKAKDIISLYDDDGKGTTMALEHLYHLGHRIIGYAGRWNSDPLGRMDAYCRFLKEKGLSDDERLVFNQQRFKGERFSIRVNNLRTWLRDILKSGLNPTAFFCYSDDIGVYMINSLMMLGKRIPQDVALVGYTDIEIAASARPPLTTVRIPVEEMCTQACQILTDPGRGRDIKDKEIEYPNELVIRDTCGYKLAQEE